MPSVETRRRPSGIDVIIYLIAIAAWGLAILTSPHELSYEWIIDVPLPPYLMVASAAAALIALAIAFLLGRAGVKSSPLFILYAAAVFYAAYLTNYHLQGGSPADVLFLTPVFCVVLGVFLAHHCGWGLFRLFLLTLVIGFAHYHAMGLAVANYDDNSAAFKLITQQIPVTLDNKMISPGFVGGIVGAGLSFLGLSIAGRGFRKPTMLILYVLILGVIGAIGLAASDDGSPTPYVWLYLPWQIVFGFMLASLAGKGVPSRD